MKLQFKLLLAFCSLISQKLCYLPDLCGGADPIEVCCGGGEYPGNGCCAAVSCLVLESPEPVVPAPPPNDLSCDRLDLTALCCNDNTGEVACCENVFCQDVLPFPPVDFGNNCAAVLCSTEVIDPQCCDGVDYPNSCLARCSNDGNLDNCLFPPGECGGGELPAPGPIDCSVVLCSSEFTAPYCCNGKSVGNRCLAQCVEGITDIDQECSPGYCPGDGPVICPTVYAPVCCNGQTFSNNCVARGQFGDDVDTVCVSGACDEPVICPAVFAPLCCNGETFSNDCFAAAEFGDDVDSVCVSGACEDQVACITIYDPVCCYGTEQFGNSCEAGKKYGDVPNFSEVCVPGECVSGGPECDQPVNCFLDPCQLATCKFSGAVCVPNYCEGATYLGTDVGGPCNAIWVDPQNKVVLTQQQCRKPFGFGDILGGVGNYIPVCCDGRTYFNIDRAESDLGVTAAAELCVDGACSISIFPGFTSP
eukprot:TRINITY_DN9072_c0_g1_i14.p1 TRINITY_DN9072_c0_g1~~TRINITY_DN9072_c0_g1_i14.p1  ORF type:complete len:476 (-),score=95.23 TRINITY_DN9072_c0_g1_i14:461-1888(-)